jgi:hypothetical protein
MTRNLPAAMILAGTAGVVPLAGPLQAQAIAESALSATISQRFEVDDNLNLDEDSPGTSFFGDTRFALNLLQETSTQRLLFGFDTGLRALWEAEQDFEFTFADPTTANLGFRQDWAGADFSADFRYRQRRVDFLDDITFTDVIVDGETIQVPDTLNRRDRDATERRYDAAIGLGLATDRPSSYRFNLRGAFTDYDQTGDDLNPRQDVRGDALWTLRLNPVLSSAVLGSYGYVSTDDAVDDTIEVIELDGGFIYDPSEVLSLTFGLGYANRQRRQTEGGVRRTTEDESGPVVRAGFNYDVADEIRVVGNIRVSAAAPETRTSGNLRASYDLPQAVISASLSQDYVFSGDGDEVSVTRAGLGFSRELDPLTSVSFDVSYGLQANQDVDTSDITRADFTATVNRTIAQDVFATAGYRFRYRDEDGSATSNAVFFSIGRTFDTLF